MTLRITPPAFLPSTALRFLKRFGLRDEGSVSIMMLYFIACMLIMGGVLADISNRNRVHTILQTTADMAAASGATRLSEPRWGSSPRSVARWTAHSSLDSTHLDGAWTSQSFDLGTIDENGAFKTSGDQPDAVRVTLRRTTGNGNPEPTMLLRIIGIDHWDIEAESVARIIPQDSLPCINPLLSLKTRVDIGATDLFAGVCLKAQASVAYGAEPVWLTAQLKTLIDGLLAQALGLTSLTGGILGDTLGGVVGGTLDTLGGVLGGSDPADHTWEVRDLGSDLRNVVASVPNILNAAVFDTATLEVGQSYHVECDENEVLNIEGPVTLTGIAIFSDCPVRIDGDVSLELSVIVSNLISLLGDPELAIEPNLSITRGGNCQPGDGVKIFVFLDLNASLGIPAIVDPASPLGGFLQDVVDLGGETLATVLNTLGPVLSTLTETISTTTDVLGLAKVCLGADMMLTSETVQLQ